MLALKYVAQGQPGSGLAFGDVRCGLQLGGGAQKLFGVGLAGLHQHQTEIEIGFEHTGLGRDGLAVGGDRVVGLAQRVVEKSQVEPGGISLSGSLRDNFFQQRLGGGVVLLFDRALGLDEFRRGRGIVDCDFVMADGLAGVWASAKLARANSRE